MRVRLAIDVDGVLYAFAKGFLKERAEFRNSRIYFSDEYFGSKLLKHGICEMEERGQIKGFTGGENG